MLKYVGLIALTAAVILIEVPSLWKRRLIKDLWIFAFLLFFGVGLVIMRFLDLPVPNPVNGINYLLQPIAEAVLQYLGGGQ